jgi:hypothetical protein
MLGPHGGGAALRVRMRILVLLLAMLAPALAQAASQVRSPTTCASFDIGNPGSGWTNPGNAVSTNNAYATATANDNQSTDALVCTGYGFSVPAGATILGIIMRIERRTSVTAGTSPTRDSIVRILQNGAATPTEGATATNYTTADVVEAHGSATELWGATWTDADINNANFGAGFVAQKAGATGGVVTISVDHIQIEVFYNTAPPAPTLSSPANGATEFTPTPTFAWNAAVDPDGDAVTYEIQVDDSGCGFASPEFTQSGIGATSVTSSPLPNATYCWRVRATDSNGLSGPWSATRDVTINAGVTTSSTASPANCVTQNVGNPNWNNPTRAETSNNQVATVALNDGGVSDYLVCDQYGFAIPANATIVGIVIDLERRATNGTVASDFSMRVLKGGTAQAAERATGTVYTTGDTVESHGGASDLWGTTWTPVDINDPNFGARFQATKFGTAGGNITISVDHMPITVYWVVAAVVTTPEGFNAVEVAADAITGQIQTKVAGSAFSLDVVAVSGGALMASFGGTVLVDVLGNAALGVALDAQNCPTSFTVLQTVGTNPTLVAGRVTVNFSAIADSWRDVRVRVRYPTGSPTVTACSADNFAIRPDNFALEARDQDWEQAGAARLLDNGGASGGNVHKAGRPFRLIVTPSPGTATNYSGSPIESARSCTLPAGCADGNLSLGAFGSGGSGTRVSDSTYDEVGVFSLTLVDQDYASVDADDTPANCGGRYVCQSAAATIGRFVPDHFAFTVPGLTPAPQFRTFDMTCAAARSFTYVGAPFGYATAPSATVEARNAAGNVTTNYRGTGAGGLFKLTAAGLTQNYSMTGQTIATSLSAAALTAVGNGTATFTANTNDRITIQRDNATASAPFNGAIELRWIAEDTSEVVLNGTITTSPSTGFLFNGTGSGIGFDAGATTGEFRYGRLRVANANGSQLTALPVLVEAQYYNGATFITNAADNCSAIANNNVAFAFAGNLNACETALSGGGTLSGGRRTFVLSAPGSNNDGAATLTVNLSNAVLGSTCTAVGGAGPAAAGANLPWLQGNWSGGTFTLNPSGRATFGVFRGSDEVIFIRENF